MFFARIAIILFSIVFTTSSQAEVVDLLMYKDYPPFSYGSTKSPKGLYYVLPKAIFEHANHQIKVKVLPWKRTLTKGKDGEGIISGLYKTPDRAKIMKYSEAFFSEDMVLYKRTDDTFKFSKMEDLRDKKIGTIRGFTYGALVNDARDAGIFKVDEATNDEDNFKKLISSRIDLYIANSLTALVSIHQLKIQDKIKRLGKPLTSDPIFISMKKGHPQNSVIDDFNKSLKKMKADGSYDKIINDFLKTN
jgi:polar amino acid transport system substrate-binding protein